MGIGASSQIPIPIPPLRNLKHGSLIITGMIKNDNKKKAPVPRRKNAAMVSSAEVVQQTAFPGTRLPMFCIYSASLILSKNVNGPGWIPEAVSFKEFLFH
jgi:hypothetical protein